MNENENKTYQNLCKAVKAIIEGKSYSTKYLLEISNQWLHLVPQEIKGQKRRNKDQSRNQWNINQKQQSQLIEIKGYTSSIYWMMEMYFSLLGNTNKNCRHYKSNKYILKNVKKAN